MCASLKLSTLTSGKNDTTNTNNLFNETNVFGRQVIIYLFLLCMGRQYHTKDSQHCFEKFILLSCFIIYKRIFFLCSGRIIKGVPVSLRPTSQQKHVY